MEVVLVRTKNSTVTFDTATKLLAVQVDGGQIQEVPFELTRDDMELATSKYLELLEKVGNTTCSEEPIYPACHSQCSGTCAEGRLDRYEIEELPKNPTFDDFLKAKKVLLTGSSGHSNLTLGVCYIRVIGDNTFELIDIEGVASSWIKRETFEKEGKLNKFHDYKLEIIE
jgi:hypothetical protein